MKLRRLGIENVRSFLDREELQLPGELSIIIGPNGGGKTNLLDTAVLALRVFLLLCNGLNRGDETVPHIPYPGEL